MTDRRTSRQRILAAGTVVGVTTLSGVLRRTRPANEVTTWTLWSPLTSSCGGDYPNHANNALDFGGSAGAWVYVYFDAGPFKGYAKVTNGNLWSCSTAYELDHRKVTFDLYADDASTVIGNGLAEHVLPFATTGSWVWGGGGVLCQIAGGSIPDCDGVEPDDPECDCWTAPHVHYGANGSKLPYWDASCHSVTAGKTACWQWAVP